MSEDFRTSYMDEALFNLPGVIERARTVLADVDFDTIVGTGFSGGVVVPSLAMALGKDFLLVRKDGDDSHHSGRLLGSLGKRWIFVDDFVASGRTWARVMRHIAGHGSEYVGLYSYQMFNPSDFRRGIFESAEDRQLGPRWCPTHFVEGIWQDDDTCTNYIYTYTCCQGATS